MPLLAEPVTVTVPLKASALVRVTVTVLPLRLTEKPLPEVTLAPLTLQLVQLMVREIVLLTTLRPVKLTAPLPLLIDELALLMVKDLTPWTPAYCPLPNTPT